MIRRPPRSPLFPYTDALPISLYSTSQQARAQALRQIDLYEEWHTQGRVRLLKSVTDLDHHLELWRHDRKPGLVLRSEEHTSELQSRFDLVCRLLLEKKKNIYEMAATETITSIILIKLIRVSLGTISHRRRSKIVVIDIQITLTQILRDFICIRFIRA